MQDVFTGESVAKTRRKRTEYIYDPELYKRKHKDRQVTILWPWEFDKSTLTGGLDKKDITAACQQLSKELEVEILPNTWWAAAGLLALRNPKAVKQILNGRDK